METKIASYQEPGIRLQLIKIEHTADILISPIYQIRKNRKVLCNLKNETPAKQKFNALIKQNLLQTKMNL